MKSHIVSPNDFPKIGMKLCDIWSADTRELYDHCERKVILLSSSCMPEQSIGFLETLNDLEGVYVIYAPAHDYKVIERLTWIKRLHVHWHLDGGLDVSELRSLTVLRTIREARIRGWESCKELRHFIDGSFAVFDIARFVGMEKLLRVALGRCKSIECSLDDFVCPAKDLVINGLTKELDLSLLRHFPKVRQLELTYLRTNGDWGAITQLQDLQSLELYAAGNIDNLDWVFELKNLQELVLRSSTNILDGRLARLVEHPSLVSVRFDHRPHYDARMATIEQRLSEIRGTGVLNMKIYDAGEYAEL